MRDDVRFRTTMTGRVEVDHLGLPNVVPPGPPTDNTLLDLLANQAGNHVRVTVETLFDEDADLGDRP